MPIVDFFLNKNFKIFNIFIIIVCFHLSVVLKENLITLITNFLLFLLKSYIDINKNSKISLKHYTIDIEQIQ